MSWDENQSISIKKAKMDVILLSHMFEINVKVMLCKFTLLWHDSSTSSVIRGYPRDCSTRWSIEKSTLLAYKTQIYMMVYGSMS